MHLLVTLIAAVVLVGGIFVNQKSHVGDQEVKEPVVLSEEVTVADNNITPTLTPSITDDASSSENGEDSLLDLQSGEEDESQQLNDIGIENFVFPDSTVVYKDNGKLQLESYTDSDTITDWYKTKIDSMEMNVKTFAKTKANEKVLNKLVAVNGSYKIEIEISQETQVDIVKITVNLSEQN